MRSSPAIATCIAVVMLFVPSTAAAARPVQPSADAGIAVHFESRDLSEIVQALGRATGERFIYGDDLRGIVTITVPGRVSADEALELLNAALFLRGYAILPMADGVKKIVPLAETSSGAPFVAGVVTPDAERPITTLIHLENAAAESVVSALAGFVPGAGAVFSYPPTNSIVMAGTESQVRRLITIARVLDRAADENLLILAIRYRSADFVAGLIEDVFNQTVVSARRVGVWTDGRTNRLIVQGDPAQLDEIRQFVDEVDVPQESGGLLQVVRIINRDVDEVAALLEGLSEGPVTGPQSLITMQGVTQFGGALAGRDYSITVDRSSRSLVIRADPGTFEILSRLIGKIDKIPARVSVEVIIFQLSRPSAYTFGVDYFLPVTTPKSTNDLIAFIEHRPSGGDGIAAGPDSVMFARYGRKPLIFTFEDEAGNSISIPISRESVAVQAGEHTFEASLLMRPHIVAISGEANEIFIGNNIPIPVAAGSAAATTTTEAGEVTAAAPNPFLSNRQTIERQDVGVRMRITPTLGEDTDILLEVDLQLTDIGPPIAGDPIVVGVSLEERILKTRIRLNEGEIAVIGTSEQQSEAYRVRGIPFLMNIPLVGYLFKRVDKRVVDTSLVMIVEARVMRSPSDDVAETIRRRMALERSMARVSDLGRLSESPYAVLLDTVLSESMATRIADTFTSDGFDTRVISWQASGQPVWDVYVIELASFDEAGGLARHLYDAGWRPEITVLPRENELAGD
ncbi:MAG: hypothetical protein JRE70_03050 [Deltaproteobacteria bacterium]|nr:hypothetical protein [Deltaproteobacteria bacterium]